MTKENDDKILNNLLDHFFKSVSASELDAMVKRTQEGAPGGSEWLMDCADKKRSPETPASGKCECNACFVCAWNVLSEVVNTRSENQAKGKGDERRD